MSIRQRYALLKADAKGERIEASGEGAWEEGEQKYGLKKTRNIYPTEIRHDVKIQIALIIIYFTLPSVAPLPSEKTFPDAHRRERTFRLRCTPNVDPPENRRESKDGPKGTD